MSAGGTREGPSELDALEARTKPAADAPEQDVLDTPAAGGLIVRGGAVRFGSYVGVVGLSVISAALLTRYLGVVRFGAYTTVISLVTIVSSVTDAGMSGLGTREYAVRSRADRDQLMGDLLGLRVTLTLIGVVLATLFALAAGWDPALVAGTAVAALAVLALVLQHTLSIPLSTSLRIGTLSALDLARQALTVVLLVGLIAAGADVFALLAVSLVVNVLLLWPTARLVRGEISLRPSLHPRKWAALMRLTVYFSLAAAASTIYLYIAQILTSLIASDHQSGLFAAAFRVFVVIAAVPGMLVANALPLLARAARDDRARLGYALQRTFEVTLIAGVAAALGVVAGARLIIAVVAGPKFTGAVGVLQIEGFALIGSFVLATWGFGLLSLQRHREMLIANLLALAVSAGLTLLLAETDGARGAAIASVCGESVLALVYVAALVRSDPAYRPELGVAAKVLLAAVPAAVVALVPDLSQLVQPLAALAVFGAVIVLSGAIPDELYELLPPRLRMRSR
jgi:O-antigen/teichoic acid export membrane protein